MKRTVTGLFFALIMFSSSLSMHAMEEKRANQVWLIVAMAGGVVGGWIFTALKQSVVEKKLTDLQKKYKKLKADKPDLTKYVTQEAFEAHKKQSAEQLRHDKEDHKELLATYAALKKKIKNLDGEIESQQSDQYSGRLAASSSLARSNSTQHVRPATVTASDKKAKRRSLGLPNRARNAEQDEISVHFAAPRSQSQHRVTHGGGRQYTPLLEEPSPPDSSRPAELSPSSSSRSSESSEPSSEESHSS